MLRPTLLLAAALLFAGCASTRVLPRTIALPPAGSESHLVAGDHQTCLLTGDGVPRCWSTPSRYAQPDAKPVAPVAIEGIDDASLLALGGSYGCAVRSGGVITCWETQMGGGVREVKDEKPYDPIGNITAIAASGRVAGHYGCVIDDAGKFACFRDGVGLMPDRPPREHALTRMSAGEGHSCGIDPDQRAVCWGANDAGQLGFEGFKGGVVPGLEEVADIAVGMSHTCAITAAGAVWCWGDNKYGQLGDGSDGNQRMQPQLVPGVSDAISLALGAHHSCAVRRSGKLSCWGRNVGGGLADHTTKDRSRPVDSPGLNDAVRAAAAYYQTCVLRRSGAVTCFGKTEVQSFKVRL